LIGSHNSIEADASNTRRDLYETGDNFRLDMDLFMQFYNLGKDNPDGYTIDVLGESAQKRFEQSKAENPYFFYGPATGLVFRNAGFGIAARLFANYSSEHPDGLLSESQLVLLCRVLMISSERDSEELLCNLRRRR